MTGEYEAGNRGAMRPLCCWALMSLVGISPLLGCAASTPSDDALTTKRTGLAASAQESASHSPSMFGWLLDTGRSPEDDEAEIAKAAQEDPFPTAAEVLGR